MRCAGKCLLFLLFALLFVGCDQPADKKKDDVLTQTPLSKDRIPVTVLVKYAFSIHAFERAVEKKFPHLDIIQVGNFTKDRGVIEYARRMEHDDLTDIVMTWPLKVGEAYWDDRLIDLSGMSFTNRYATAMLNNIARDDGKLFYLPGPAQVRGIVYNKTLFEEKGWKVPKNFETFLALCQQIETSGIRAIQLGFGNPEVLDTAFVGYNYDDYFSTPADAQWIADYNNRQGSFGDHFRPALNTFQQMIDAGIWKKNDLQVRYSKREQMLFNRQCAMIEDSVLVARMGYKQAGTNDKFALMPFFNPSRTSDWARLYMVCFIGLNKHLLEPQNKEKYDLILELMDYISTPEGQQALAADTGAMYSSVKGCLPPDAPEVEELTPALRHGRYAVFPELKNAQKALREGLAGMLAGTLSQEDVIQMVDQQNLNPPKTVPQEIIGTATEDFTLIETGNFLTDAMRAKTNASVALFLDNGKDGKFNGKGISARLYKGPQTGEDVFRVLPDLKHDETGALQVVTMTGENLIRTLEYAIPVDNQSKGWFYYFSGLRVDFSPTAELGKRILKVADSDGKPLDLSKVYRIAIMDQTVPEEFILSVTDTGITINDLMTEAIRSQKPISPSSDGRFVICGS